MFSHSTRFGLGFPAWVFLGILTFVAVPVLGQNLDTLPSKFGNVSVLSYGLQSGIIKMPQADIFYDTSGCTDVLSLLRTNKFRPNKEISIPKTDSPVWLKFSVRNTSQEPLVIWLDDPAYDTIQTFSFSQDSLGQERLVLSEQSGLTKNTRPIAGLPPSLIYFADADSSLQTVFVRLRSREPMSFLLSVGTPDALRKEYELRSLLNAVIVGVMLGLTLYNGLLCVLLRSWTYLIYTGYAASALLFVLNLTGLSVLCLGEFLAEMLHGRSLELGGFVLMYSIVFAMRFLHLGQNMPRLNRIGKILVGLISCTILLLLFLPSAYQIATYALIIVAIVSAVFCLGTGLRAGIGGYKPAWLYLLAWGILLIMSAIFLPASVGILAITPMFVQLPQITIALELLLMSFALAYRIRGLQASKQEALRENERIVSEQNRILEQKVQQRTKDLKEANLQLSAASEEIQRQLTVQTEQAVQIEVTNTELQETAHNLALVNQELTELNQQLALQTEELRVKNQALAEAEQFRINMLSIVSHDLKNPISVITGLTSVLIDSHRGDESSLEMLRFVNDSGERMNALVRDLLDTAARNTGKINLHKAPTELKDITASVLAHYIHATERKKQQFICRIEGEYWVYGDVQRLFQVFDNLISNAVKYSPEGGTIWVSIAKKGTKALWSVQDEGQGFSEEDKIKAFGFFQKLSAEPTGGESSSGVGLAIVRQIVELHGGTVRIENTCDASSVDAAASAAAASRKGARMIVELPLYQANEE